MISGDLRVVAGAQRGKLGFEGADLALQRGALRFQFGKGALLFAREVCNGLFRRGDAALQAVAGGVEFVARGLQFIHGGLKLGSGGGELLVLFEHAALLDLRHAVPGGGELGVELRLGLIELGVGACPRRSPDRSQRC